MIDKGFYRQVCHLRGKALVIIGVFLASAILGEESKISYQPDSVGVYAVLDQEFDLGKHGLLRLADDEQGDGEWLQAVDAYDTSLSYLIHNRLWVELVQGAEIDTILRGRAMTIERWVNNHTCLILAPNALSALQLAAELKTHGSVEEVCPIMVRPRTLFSAYGPAPNDLFFEQQWNLENRDPDTAQRVGPDLNLRAAWPFSEGEAVTISVVDDGIDWDHVDLGGRRSANDEDHENFTVDGGETFPLVTASAHGTSVAGLAAAEAGNGEGIAGVAPQANLAAWMIFVGRTFAVSDSRMGDMFQYRTEDVWVQNHSWGSSILRQLPKAPAEEVAINFATQTARNGKGVVMVRAAGNGRETGSNANDDGYLADHRVIPVAAVRSDGIAARFSNPGACVLVAAPSGDESVEFDPCIGNSRNIVTTDRVGGRGFNRRSLFGSNSGPDYVHSQSFIGTSASCPQIAGLSALLLSMRPELGYRDIQQILILASKQTDYADSLLSLNGAGFRVGPNLGYGVPNAGAALQYAQRWLPRSALKSATYTSNRDRLVPDVGLQLKLSGPGLPSSLQSLFVRPIFGPHTEGDSATIPLVHVGEAIEPIGQDLTGKAALIRRAPLSASTEASSFFCQKLAKAADAGAEFAIIYNDRIAEDDSLFAGNERNPIPAVFLKSASGSALLDHLETQPEVLAQIALERLTYEFNVTEAMLCEHVAVRINSVHPARGDLRIVLESPSGTRSLLQNISGDNTRGPLDWTYVSTHHFFEQSRGTWKVYISDEHNQGSGRVISVGLTVFGTDLQDLDGDGLDDAWEHQHFGNLDQNQLADPDEDGIWNAKEFALRQDPNVSDIPFRLERDPWNEQVLRLRWPSSERFRYRVLSRPHAGAPGTEVAVIEGDPFETEWMVDLNAFSSAIFNVQALDRSSE